MARRQLGSNLVHLHIKSCIYSSKLNEFADNNFECDENGRGSSKRVNSVGKRRNCSLRRISFFPAVFSKDLYCRHVRTRACLRKGSFKLNKLLHMKRRTGIDKPQNIFYLGMPLFISLCRKVQGHIVIPVLQTEYFSFTSRLYKFLLLLQNKCFRGVILESDCLSVGVFVCPSVCLCTKNYFLSKRWWMYQVTFSDSSS